MELEEKILQLDIKELGKTIEKVRKNKKITQIDLCKKINISQTYLSQIESGIKLPKIQTLSKISKELNFPTAYFFILAQTSSKDYNELNFFREIIEKIYFK